MFDFFGLFKRGSSSDHPQPPSLPQPEDEMYPDDDDVIDDASAKGAGGAVLFDSSARSIQAASEHFAKPEYSRQMFNATSGVGKAIRDVKQEAFSGGRTPVDLYTGNKLELTVRGAKMKYGDDWQSHLAEVDHIEPVERIHRRHGDDAFTTTHDLDDVANSPENMEVVSRKFNNLKRSKTNREFVESEKAKEAGVTEEGAKRAAERGDEAQRANDKKLGELAAKNALDTFHSAGMQGAADVGTTAAVISTVNNIRDVISGKKKPEEAIKDIGKDAAKGAATGYIMGGGLTTVTQALSSSSSPLIQSLVKSNVPAKVVTAVMMTGSTLKKYAAGEITTEQCLLALGESGASFAAYGHGAIVGQALIPIPVVGAVIGGMIASAIVSNYGSKIRGALEERKKRHERSVALVREYERIADEERAYRAELEQYIESYFREYRECFETALGGIRAAYAAGDADGMIAGANMITRKLGGTVHYDTVDEFKNFLNSGEDDLI